MRQGKIKGSFNMNQYEEKRQARIERMKARAARAREESGQLYERAEKMSSVIPFGQPILVGHYSEKSDRNYRDRIHRTYGKSFELKDKAEELERRAKSAEKNRIISSDDPEAITKLERKIEILKSNQETMKAVNRVIKNNHMTKENKIEELKKIMPKCESFERLFVPDFAGRVGFPDYLLTNNNGNIHRLQKRVDFLKQQQGQEHKETERPDGIKIIENVDLNRIQIIFPGKPCYEVRQILKQNGFRWSPSNLAWQRQLNHVARHHAEYALNRISELPEVKQ
jgi:hypothetical protein